MNNTINRMMIGTSLIGITFSLNITDAYAEACRRVPSCAEMGFVATSCPAGVGMLKCPFDQSKVFCAKDCDGFNLNSCPPAAACTQCWTGKYRRDGCADGYLAEGDDCVVNPCEGFTLTSQNVTHCGDYEVCQSGDTMKYKCKSCEDGYVPSKIIPIFNQPPAYYPIVYNYYNNNGVLACAANPCYFSQGADIDEEGNLTYFSGTGIGERFRLTSKNDGNCTNSDSYSACKSGDTTYYVCHDCKNGYGTAMSNGYRMNSTSGTCISYSAKDECPWSKGWGSDGNAASTVSCYSDYYDQYTWKYRPTACKDGYHINYRTFRCVSN